MESKVAIDRLSALAHEARLQVFRRLVRAGPEGLAAGHLARELGCPPPTLSFHLKDLRSAGLVTRRREGRSVRYVLATDAVRELMAFLAEDCCQSRRELCAPVGSPPDARAEDGERPRVLFVCSHNAARSQMAEALLRARAGDRFDIRSAGVRPSALHPMTVAVMDEIGIDVAGADAEDLGSVIGGPPSDVAIVVCEQAERDCRDIYPFALTRLYWPFDDPGDSEGSDADRLQRFRDVRDAIDRRIRQWLDDGASLEARA